MNSKEVAKKLRYNSAKDMFNAVGYKDTSYHKLRSDKKELKLKEIILDHYSIDTKELLSLIQLKEDITNINK